MKKEDESIKLNKNDTNLSKSFELIEYEPLTKSDAIEEFILEVVEKRGELKITQKELAELLNTTQSVISRFENLGRKPGYEFMNKITKALGGKLKITLNGDYTVIVPKELRDRVDELAVNENMEKEDFLNILVIDGLENWENRHKIIFSKIKEESQGESICKEKMKPIDLEEALVS